MNSIIGNRLKLFGLILLFQGASLSAEDSFLYRAGLAINAGIADLGHLFGRSDAPLEPRHEKLTDIESNY